MLAGMFVGIGMVLGFAAVYKEILFKEFTFMACVEKR